MVRGGGSSAHSAPSDITPPSQPTDVVIKNDGKQITGKAEPGSKITIKDDQGNVIANGKADEQGNFSIDLNPPKNNGEKVEVTATDKAGNTSKPTDVTAPDITPPNKPENLDVSDDGTHVTGTAEPGSTVVIRDENGDQIGSATADPETGAFEAELNTPKTNGETLTAEATDGAGNTSPKAGVDADDNTAPPAPTLTNDSEDNKLVATEDKDITGSAPDAAGGTAVLVDGDGNPVKDSAGNPITAPIDNNGNFTLPAAGVPDGDYGVQVKDKAGNSSTDNAPISIDRTVPKITSVEFADNNNPSDNQLTRNEVGTDGKTWVNVNFDKATVKVDDVIKVNGVDHKITEADITAGQAQIEIPVGVAPGSQGTLKVTAQITDTAGNQSSTADNSIAVNRAVDGIPRVEYIDNGANGGSKDGTLTAAEIGLDEKVTARIVLPGNLEDGDKVSIPGLSETPYMVSGDKVGDFPIGTNAKGEKYIDVQVPVAEGATSLTTLVVVTVDGTDLPATGNIKVDTVAPQEAPVLTVEGVTAEDTTINAAEAKDGLDLKVTIPQGTQEGDHIIIKDGTTTLLDRPLTKEEAESNAINLTIDAPENGITVNLTATVKEPREDGIAKTSDPVTATVDTAIPGGADANDDGLGDAAPVITFTQDTQPKDGKLNAAELDGQKAAVTIEVPTDVVINDTLVYTVNGGTEQTVNITAAVKDNGFTVPADQLPETGTITVKAYVKDAAGNRSAEAEEAAKIDTSIAKPTPTAGEDGSVNITLPSDAEKGDTVEVKYTDEAGNPQTVTLTKGDDGWTSDKPELINHPTGDTATIPEDGVKDNTPVEITAKDTAGNTSSADSFKAPDVTAPSKPEFDEPQDDGSVKINLPTDANPGDQVKVTVTPEGATEPTTVTLKKQPDGTWESDKPEIINHPTGDTATIPEDQVKDGSQVTAVATDGTNSSDPTTADATDTRTPMLSLTEQSADKVLGKDEGNSITGKVTYDSTEETADKAEGATVILKNAQGEQVAKTTAAADGTFTFASVADGTYSIEVTSASGETGAPITDVLVDHKAPAAKDITLANDTAGASATDNISYDGTLVTPTLGDGESIKSVTVGDNPVPVVNGKYVLNPGVYEAESIKVVVQDKAGHETTSTNSKAITIDTTAPGQPTIEPQTNGSVNITLPSGENVKADDTVEVTYTDESGVKQTVTFTKGEDGWTSDKPTLIANPTGNTATIPATSVQDGSEVTAVAKDPTGNESPAIPQNAGDNPDTTAPSAPDLTQKADGTMDVVLPEDAKPGDTVEVTVIPEGGTAENPTKVTLEKQPDGTWKSDKPGIIDHPTGDTATIPENQVKDGSPVTAVATDDAGNSSAPTTKNATDTRTPVVSLTGDSDDKVLKATEGDDITGTVKYSDGDIAEGAKVILVNTVTHAETAPVVADKDGKFTFADVADGTYSIKVTSASGTPGTGVDKVVVDHGVPGDNDGDNAPDEVAAQIPVVTFVDDKNPKDGVLTRNEVGSDNKVKVEVTLPTANVEEGDTVVLTTNGSTEPVKHTLTAEEITAGKITAEVPVGAIGATEKQDLTVTAKVVDAAGQSSKEGTDGIPVDRTVNGTPSIEYVEDTGSTVNGTLVGKEDGILWASENAAGDNDGASTTVKVNLPKGIGGENSTDTVTITINDKIYTLSSDGDHVGEEGAATYSIVRPAAESNEDPYVEIPVATTAISQIDAEVEVTYKKVGENTPTTVGTDGVVTLTIDSVVPGGDADNNNVGDETDKPALTIAEAANGVNADELSDGKVVATVTLPTGVQAGDHIILKDANDNVLADVQVDANKSKGDVVTIDIPKSKLPDDDYKVTAIVKEDGTNGRESAPSNEVSFKVDTDAPNAPELTVNNGGVDIALPADAQKGDTVEVKYTDENGDEQTVILTKGDNGWTSDTKDVIPDTTTTSPNTATLPANQVKDGTTVTATASDGVNPDVPATPVTVNDTRTPVITLTGESADNQLVKDDGKTITGTVTYSDGDTAEAAKVTLVNTETNAEKEVTVRADGTFSFTDVADGVYTIKAKTVGNVEASNTPTVTVDHTGPADAAITFVNNTGTADDKISSDGTLNIAPANGAGIVDGSVEYSKDGGDWTDVPVVNGKYVLPEDGTYSVRVTTEDNVGNTTTTTVDNFVVDTAPPTDATITLTSDTSESGDNISKDGGLTITPADDATIQKVEYQDATGWHTFEGETYTLPAGTYAAGAIKVTTIDTAGNTKETFNTDVITVDQTPPTQGTVTIAKDTGTLGTDGITNDGTLVTPTLGEGESIKSVIADGETIDAVDGKYVLPEKTYGAGTIKVTVVDKAGNETVSTNAAPITVDKTLPTEPTVTPATADGDGSVTVGLPTDAKVGDKVEVSVTPEGATDPVTITLTKGENNSWTPSADLPTGVTLNGDTLTIGEDAVEDGTPVNAKSIDVAGNENAATAANAGNDALSTIPSVTVAEAQDGYVNKADLDNGGLTGTTTNAPDGSTIKLLDKNDNPVNIGIVTVTGGTFTIPADQVPEGDYKITVTTPTADGGKTSAPTPLFTVDKTVSAPSLSTTGNDGDGSVTVGLPTDAKVGDKVEVSVTPEGATQPEIVTLTKGETGWTSNKPAIIANTTSNTATIPENAVQDGSTVTAKSVDTADNEAVASPDATAGNDALAADPEVTVAEAADGYVNKAELGNSGLTGETENAPNGSKVELLDEEGTPVDIGTVTVTDNKFTIPADKVPNGTYTIKVTTPEADGAKEVSTSPFTVDTAAPAASVTANTNGSVEIALPANPENGDEVAVTYTPTGEAETTATLTYNGTAWTSDDTNIQVSGNTATIAADKVKDDTDVSATASDAAGNTQAEQSSDHVPATPVITVADVTNGINATELSDGISGTVDNAPDGAKVQLYKGDAKVGSPVEVGEGGTFTILKDGVTDDEGYTVKLVGQEGTVASAPFKVDTTAPEASVTANTNGSVEIALPENPENGDTVTITYTPTGASQATTATLTYNGSNWTGIPDGFTLADGTVTIPADKVADNTTVKAVGSDLAGNTQSPAASGTTATDPVSGVTVKDLTEDGVVLDGSNGTNNTIDFVKAADLGGVVSVQGPAGTTSTVTFTSANGQPVIKTVSNDGTEKAINLTPEDVKTLTGGGSQAISVKVATGDLGEQNYSDVFTINPTSGVFELIPSVNNVSTNDSVHPEVDAVLNGTEQPLGSGGKDTAISYMLIIPSTAQIGDKVTIYNGTTEVPFTLDTQAKVDSWKAGKTGLRYNIDLDESTLSTGQEVTLKAIYTPKDGQPQTLSHTYWYDGKAPTVGVETTNTTATVTLPTESDAASVTVKVGDATVTLVKDGSNWVPQAGNTITPTIENGKAVFSDLATGTTVTATATDTVGNTSAEVSAVTQIIPMSISAVSVTDENSTTDGVQVVDNDVSFSYTLAGQLDEGKLIRVRVVDESGAAVGETKYFTPTQGETTDSLALPAADGQALKVVADIVDAVYRDSAVDGSAKNAAFTLDNVASHNASLTDNSHVTIDGTPVNHTFGTARDDKYYDVGNVRVHNPKLDWEMRWEDNTMPGKGWGSPSGNGDNANGSEYHLDTALNWSESKDGYKYYWTGVADKSHVIIAAKVRTDDGYGEAYKQGLIGTENAYDGKTHFEMNTNSNLADYIQSEGIVGNVNISTQGGDDTITTKYLNGKYWLGKGDFNGSERIFMGDGNDTFEVTGSAYSTGYGDSLADNAAFYMTNAKIDMGGGNDIVKITGGQITAAREFNVGNYFLLGSGNDAMETRTITSEKDEDQATNIINLGSGHDTLTVNGDIMSHEDAVYRTANPRNGADQQARFLLMSRDSSDVHITGNVGGKVTMLMGSGDDNIRIDQELWMSDKANAMDWLSITLNRAEISGNKDYYINEDSNSIRGEINTALAAGVSNSGATGLGATSLTNNQNALEQDDLHIADIAARIDLGNGNNTFSVGGSVNNAHILSGIGNDTVKLAFNADGQPNSNTVNNTKVWTGDDNDDIQLYDVNGRNNEIHAGNGGDIIRLYGVVNNSNSNTIDGGADYDKVIIGNKNDSAASKFLVGGSEDGYTNFWSIEEIQFNSGVSGSGDTVKVNAQILNDNRTLYIRGTSELNAQGTEALGVNTVDIDMAVWKDEGTTTKELSDGTSYTYHHYSYVHDNTTEHLYIQNGIRVL